MSVVNAGVENTGCMLVPHHDGTTPIETQIDLGAGNIAPPPQSPEHEQEHIKHGQW